MITVRAEIIIVVSKFFSRNYIINAGDVNLENSVLLQRRGSYEQLPVCTYKSVLTEQRQA